jgi:hypothetical protein
MIGMKMMVAGCENESVIVKNYCTLRWVLQKNSFTIFL